MANKNRKQVFIDIEINGEMQRIDIGYVEEVSKSVSDSTGQPRHGYNLRKAVKKTVVSEDFTVGDRNQDLQKKNQDEEGVQVVWGNTVQEAGPTTVPGNASRTEKTSLKLWGTRYMLKESRHTKNLGQFTCELCWKKFGSRNYLLKHLKRHDNVKPFECLFCSKGFMTIHDVFAHFPTHTGERAHDCKTCGTAFAQTSQLTHHERLHTGQKPYECGDCGQKFAQQGNLDKHVLIKHTDPSDLPFHCQFCGKGFPYACYLKAHTTTVHKRNYPPVKRSGKK